MKPPRALKQSDMKLGIKIREIGMPSPGDWVVTAEIYDGMWEIHGNSGDRIFQETDVDRWMFVCS